MKNKTGLQLQFYVLHNLGWEGSLLSSPMSLAKHRVRLSILHLFRQNWFLLNRVHAFKVMILNVPTNTFHCIISPNPQSAKLILLQMNNPALLLGKERVASFSIIFLSTQGKEWIWKPELGADPQIHIQAPIAGPPGAACSPDLQGAQNVTPSLLKCVPQPFTWLCQVVYG